MENMIGRSFAFWACFYPELKGLFPDCLAEVDLHRFYEGINRVAPSYIRVEADEVTYNLHILLRFELEKQLVSGALAVNDLPAAWNAKMEELLGLTPPDDAQGVLQDIHWSSISFGYFPTYALGNLYAAQFFEAAAIQDTAIPADLARGNTTSLLRWLQTNIHQHGRKFTPSEIVERVTGKNLSHEPFVAYVTRKFSEVYEL